ncbi:STE3-domain-containing protein, partial [Punctularia strigosozonata HHB-11173 SS5]|uniref:STE3-domain-containing protein n=1 Tax=Punctularia strigosozonata (strain HHB-11173) TaxID=741275 RepID=UPI0004416F00
MPVTALVAAFFVLIPAPYYFRPLNIPVASILAWLFVLDVAFAVNSIIWAGNVNPTAPTWCEITSHIIVAASVAIPAASLCINRRLYRIASISNVLVTKEQKRRDVYIDLAIGLGIPLIQLPMQYIVSGHRFDIYEDLGCYPFTYNTPVAYPLSELWPLVIGLVSASYAFLTLRAFFQRRAQFSAFTSSTSAMSISRYFRLMILAGMEILVTVPLCIYGTYLNLRPGNLAPWISWADTHAHYSRIHQIPSVIWRSVPASEISIELFRWSLVFCGFVYFALFGFADEARKHYRAAFWWIAKRFGLSPKSRNDSNHSYSGSTLPTFIHPSKSDFGSSLSQTHVGADSLDYNHDSPYHKHVNDSSALS